MYDTGARVQEVIDISVSDLRFGKTPTVTLHGKGDKIRSVPLSEKTVDNLRLHLDICQVGSTQSHSIPLFFSTIGGVRKPLSLRRVRDMIKDYGVLARTRCAEVPENVYPHLLRHSRAMHLYQHGMDLTLVSQWLGHANLDTTLVYAHADTEQKRRAIAAATSDGKKSPANISPARFKVSDEDTLKRLSGLK
jgi:site-specific recombinase XerD